MIYVKGTPIFNQGEFIALCRELPDDYEDVRLTALWAGADLEEDDVRRLLDVSVRMSALSPVADDLVDQALERMKGRDAED